jgi:hypothetical protein
MFSHTCCLGLARMIVIKAFLLVLKEQNKLMFLLFCIIGIIDFSTLPAWDG